VTSTDFIALLPLIITAYGALVVLLAGVFWRSHRGVLLLTLITLAGAFVSVFAVRPLAPRQVTPVLRVDEFALFYAGLFLLGGFAVAVFSHDYLVDRRGREKYYALLLLAVLGTLVLVSSAHFLSFLAGLETLSVSLYGLIGYTVRRPASLEASLKYLVLAGVAVAFLLLGTALLYSEFGTMSFSGLGAAWETAGAGLSDLVPLGLALMLVGFGFKLAVVPFHTWAPDVYQGAPAPVSGLVATISKAAMLALLLRLTWAFGLRERPATFAALEVLAIITMFGGNLLALLQNNIKRLIAYSSIAHMGYLLIPLLAGGPAGLSSVGFYFVAYFATTLGAFGIISALSAAGAELEELEDYRGLGLQRPWLGAALALMMLSLAGVPLTVGFMAKFYIFSAAAHAGLWLLLIVGVLNSGLAAYYYLRVLAALYLRPAEEGAGWLSPRPASAITLALLALLVLLFGVYPNPLIALAQHGSVLGLPFP
jgi:NADH-quinone oxidoreductase subunit N